MNSNLFNYLGIGGIDVAYLFIGLLGFSVILLILCIMAFVQINKFKKKYNKLCWEKMATALRKI